MSTLLLDMRHAVRVLLSRPGFTAVALLTLTLGIGASTVIVSVADGVLVRSLPFPDSDRIVTLWNTHPQLKGGREEVSPPDFYDWREQNRSFDHIAAYEQFFYVLAGNPYPVRLQAARVSGDFFAVMGVDPALGRPLLPSDDHEGSHHVAVLSNRLWRSRFGSNPSMVGQTVSLNGLPFTVLGIMPAGFEFPSNVDLWSPLAYEPPFEPILRQSVWLRTVAHLEPGVSLAQAQADMSSVARRLERQYPETNAGRGVVVVSLYEQTVGQVRPALMVLLAAVGCLLIIACTNVTNLLLARATGRHQEIAIRRALGASRRRLVSQLVTESTLLGLLGGAGGTLLALWGLELLRDLSPGAIPRLHEVQLDFRVLGFTLLASLVAGAAVGFAPAVMATGTDFREGIRAFGAAPESPRRRRLRSTLVVSEITLAYVLSVGGGLLLQSFQRLRSVDPGFDPESLVTCRFDLLSERYAEENARVSLYRQVVEQVSSLPGVQAAALATTVPMHEMQLGYEFVIEGRPKPRPSEYPSAGYNSITPDYFRTMGIRLLAGRTFTDADDEDRPDVVIINESMARRFWPGETPIGGRIRLVSDESLPDPPYIDIVGVVEDVKQVGLDAPARSEIYLPYAQRPWRTCFLLVRSESEPLGLVAALRGEIRAIDPDIGLSGFRGMNDYVRASLAPPRFRTFLLTIFAGLALILAAVGVFGVISCSVAQRTHDFAVRLALGARPSDIVRMVVGKEFLLVSTGVVLGWSCSLALTRFLSSLLFGITSYDALTFSAVALVCGGAAATACYIPSRRATKVDPMTTLRSE